MVIRNVMQPVVVPHLDNHALATRHVYMDDNARPYLSWAVTALLQIKSAKTLPWPAMSPHLNQLEHVRDILGRRLQALNPPVQTLAQLEAALHREWQQLTIQQIRRLTGGMR